MAKITVEANQCDACGHIWLPTANVAAQCAKCRSRVWNSKQSSPKPSGPTKPNVEALRAICRPTHIPERIVERDEYVQD